MLAGVALLLAAVVRRLRGKSMLSESGIGEEKACFLNQPLAHPNCLHSCTPPDPDPVVAALAHLWDLEQPVSPDVLGLVGEGHRAALVCLNPAGLLAPSAEVRLEALRRVR